MSTLMPQRARTLGQREPRKAWAHNESAPNRIRGRALQKIRKRILERDCYQCQECQRQGYVTTTQRLVVDHKVCLAAGGAEDDDNRETLCEQHNQEKAQREAHAGKARQAVKVAGG